MIHHGDCLDVMAGMDPESVDAIVTDPPYGLEFMGKAWDRGVPGLHFWQAMYDVAKPSAYLLSFGGTRTVHRIASNIEDAGWIIRDMLVWGYASGFPKSKASLKPAWEPIVMARKSGPLRMLAIDECRIGTDGEVVSRDFDAQRDDGDWTAGGNAAIHGKPLTPAEREAMRRPREGVWENTLGRWPANIVLTEEVFGDEYSRFFLIPKAARSDREPVLGGLPVLPAPKNGEGFGRLTSMDKREAANGHQHTMRQNVHPTVKPVDLMRHLVRLVTPTGGTVLDPFLGSGTTALAAEMEGFAWIGIEREAEYVAIAEARLNGTQKGMAL